MEFSESFEFGNSTFMKLESQANHAIKDENNDVLDVILESPTGTKSESKNSALSLTKSKSRFLQITTQNTKTLKALDSSHRKFRRSKSDSTLPKASEIQNEITTDNYSEFFRSDFSIPHNISKENSLKQKDFSVLRVSQIEAVFKNIDEIQEKSLCAKDDSPELETLKTESDEIQDLEQQDMEDSLEKPIFSEDLKDFLETEEQDELWQGSLPLSTVIKDEDFEDPHMVLHEISSFICPAKDDHVLRDQLINKELEISHRVFRESQHPQNNVSDRNISLSCMSPEQLKVTQGTQPVPEDKLEYNKPNKEKKKLSLDLIDNLQCNRQNEEDAVVEENIKSGSKNYMISNSSLESLKSITAWNLPFSILKEYERKGVRKMFDWQIECLRNPKVLFEHCNLVYSAPTSAGKTLVSEILLLKTVLERGKKVLLILPFISVVREKMFYLQDLLTAAGYRVEGFFGGYTPPGGFDSIHVAICTIEKANSIVNKLLEQGKLDEIGTLIVDEVHLISDPGRGYILELLLAKILYMSRKYALQIQVITMSATLANVELLKKWLDAELYITNFRPVALQEMIKIGNKIYDNNLKIIRSITEPTIDIKEPFPVLQNDSDHVAQLCIETLIEGCSVVIFCPSKDWCENLAIQLAGAIHSMGKNGGEWGTKLRAQIKREAIEEVKQQLRDIPTGLDAVLDKCVTYACSFHHAGLTTEERDIIEASFKSGALKVIVATSTLSSGVNLPARRVLIRSPLFGGKQMSSLTYRQMIGRAGRTGKDTLGESILICTDSNARIGKDLVRADLRPIYSCLDLDSSTHLKRALLEVISSGVATSKEDIENFVNCTLLSVQKQIANQEKEQSSDSTTDEEYIGGALDFLIEYEFVRLQSNEETQEQHYVATRLGMACLASSMPPTDGLILFAELQKSRRCFVLESELHAVYLVTPYSVCYQLQDLDWLLFLDLWEKLTPAMKKVGELVGVKESFLVRAMRGQTKLDYKLMQIHKRFYTALALQELVNETPINTVAIKYKCSRGMLQSLQQMASTFAGIVTSFCNSLQWDTLSLIVSQFKERLYFGIHRDLIDLMRLPDLNHKRARALFDAGITSLVELASADVLSIEQILYNALSFDSAKKNDNENELEAAQRNKARNFFITGKAGLTVAEAAKLLVQDARLFVQYEIGVGSIKWSQSKDVSQEYDKRVENDLHMSYEENKFEKEINIFNGNKDIQINKTTNNCINKENEIPNKELGRSPKETKMICNTKERINTELQILKEIQSFPITSIDNPDNLKDKNEISSTKPLDEELQKCFNKPGTKEMKSIKLNKSKEILTKQTKTIMQDQINSKDNTHNIENKGITKLDQKNMEEIINKKETNVKNKDIHIPMKENIPQPLKDTNKPTPTKTNDDHITFEDDSKFLKAMENIDKPGTKEMKSIKLNKSKEILTKQTKTIMQDQINSKDNTHNIENKGITKLDQKNMEEIINKKETNVKNKDIHIPMKENIPQPLKDTNKPTPTKTNDDHITFEDDSKFLKAMENIEEKSNKIENKQISYNKPEIEKQTQRLSAEKRKSLDHLEENINVTPTKILKTSAENKSNPEEPAEKPSTSKKAQRLLRARQLSEMKKQEWAKKNDQQQNGKENTPEIKTSLNYTTYTKGITNKANTYMDNSANKKTPTTTESPVNNTRTSLELMKNSPNFTNSKDKPETPKLSDPQKLPRRSPRNHMISSTRIEYKTPPLIKKNNTPMSAKTQIESPEKDLFGDENEDSFTMNTGINEALKEADKFKPPTIPSAEDEIPSSQQLVENMPDSPHASRFLRSLRATQKLQSPKSKPKVDDCKTQKQLPPPRPEPPSSTSIELSDLSMENSLIKNPIQLNASHILSCSKVDTDSSSFKSIDIIDICGDQQLFKGAFKELMANKRLGFCLGIQQQSGKRKPIIGGNLLINQVAAAEREQAESVTYEFQIDDTNYLAGIGFCISDNIVYYMNMQQEGTCKGLTGEIKCKYLRMLLRSSEHSLLVYDAKEQMKIIRKLLKDVEEIPVALEDPKVANWLLQPDKMHNLHNLALQFAPECTALVKLCGSSRGYNSYGLDSDSAILAKIRCSIEACVTIHILKGQIENLERIGTGQLHKFFTELEMPLQMSLCNMEHVGLPTSSDALHKLFQQMVDGMKKLETKIYEMHGSRFNLGSSSAVARVVGLHRKTNGRISTSKQILEKIDSPISQMIITYRKLSVTLTKNIQPLLKCVKNERIHGQSITFTSTGRISMTEPNLQNVAKDFEVDMGAEKFIISCRSAFYPVDTKRCLISSDFCQLEMRILAHLSQDNALLQVMKSDKDIFLAIAAHWNKISENSVTEKLRNGTKQICYGIVYGMGMRALAEGLKCTEQEAKIVSQQFHNAYPGIRSYTEKVVKFARNNGYIETITGRRRYLELINSEEALIKNQAERQAVNTTVQGSAADIAKSAILRMEKNVTKYRDKLGIEPQSVRLVLHLHDELLFEVPEDKAKKIAKVLSVTMENCVKLSVPLKVKLKIGKSWGDLKEIKL